MQDCAGIAEEIVELTYGDLCREVEVVLSGERWSPVAAVLLLGCQLPGGIEPSEADLRIMLPDLYGFATTASIVAFSSPLLQALPEGETKMVPFCRPLAQDDIEQHAPYYSDLRANGDQLRGMHYLCLSPVWEPESGFEHVSLSQFLRYFLAFLEGPRDKILQELEFSRAQWDASGDPQWLLRLGYTYEGLGDTDQASATYSYGQQAFQGRAEFSFLLRRTERKSEQTSN